MVSNLISSNRLTCDLNNDISDRCTELVRGTKRKTRQSEEPESPTPPKKRATPDGDFIVVDMEKLTVNPAVYTEKIAVDPADAETAKPVVDSALDSETNGKHKLRSKAAKDRTIARAV